MIIYAVLGTSRALSVSTTTTLAILVAEGDKRHRESGVWLWLVGLNPEVLAVGSAVTAWRNPGAREDALHSGGGSR